MSSLIEKSYWYKEKAKLLLEESNLIKFLKNYGDVEIVGSYAYDLMTHGDIDIHVFNPRINKDKTIEIFHKLIKEKSKFFYAFMFGNWVNFSKKEFPYGYYLGLKSRRYHTKWKIDIWFIRKKEHRTRMINNLIKNKLNNKNKEIILKLKVFRNKNYPKLDSTIIYKAVLSGKVNTIKDFVNYINK